MTGKFSPWKLLEIIALYVFFVCFFCACASAEFVEEEAPEIPPPVYLVVPSPQETEYSGQPQTIEYHYTGKGKPHVLYYNSADERGKGMGGSQLAPVQAGTYYVRIEYSPQSEGASTESVFAEYRILRRKVKIEASSIQEAYYNGNPKRVEARSEPSLPLSYSYYQNKELMETAVRNAREAAAAAGIPTRPLSETYRGYRRVDRAPSEQGTYYVWIYFQGDENHESAETFVEFTILPPPR